MFKIQMASGFSGVHMGLVFANGIAHTNDSFLATRLQSKGYNVTAEAAADDQEVHKHVEKSKGKGKSKDKDKKDAAAPEDTVAPEDTADPEPAPAEPSELPPTDDEVDE